MAWLLTPCLLAALGGMVWLYPSGYESPNPSELGFGAEPVHGDITATAASSCQTSLAEPGANPPPPAPPPGGGDQDCVRLDVTLTSGEGAGRVITQVLPVEPGTPRFAVGDQVVLSYAGSEPDNPMSYQVVDYQRGPALAWLAALFALSVVLLARWKGLTSLLGLALSFLVLVFFVLPAILAGQDAVLVGVVGSGVIMFIVLYLAHGFSARTSTAVLGTLLSLGLIALLGVFFASTTRLTGLDDETTNLITIVGGSIDPRGLLLAGALIGALGVLDDVTVTQTSAVWELRAANPALGWRQLYAAGLRIGRDHISAAVNTLALAYAGAALPMLLAYSLSGIDFGTLVGAQVVAQEIVRTLVGSIGLVAAVPITTAIAAVVASREDPPNPGDRTPRSDPGPEDGGGTEQEDRNGDGPAGGTSDTRERTGERAPSEAGGRRRRAEPDHRPPSSSPAERPPRRDRRDQSRAATKRATASEPIRRGTRPAGTNDASW
nr:YibE/F family protein [Actinoalloteichus caeruleus]